MPDSRSASPAHSSQISTASECSDADIKTESYESKINVHTPAVVAWEGQHTRLDLFVQYDRATSTAFLKLRARLVLKALSPVKSYLYLLIPPERLQGLTLDDTPDADTIPPDTAKVLGSSFTCLRLRLKAVTDLIGPKVANHKPKNQVEGRVLDQLRSIARSHALAIFVPHHVLPKSQLLAVCYGISDRLLRSDPGQIDLACLYEGRGGVKMAVGAPDVPSKHALKDVSKQSATDIPPSYADTGPPPPVVAGSSQPPASKKRRLDHDTAVEPSGDLLAAMRKMVREEVRVQVSEEVRKLEARMVDKLVDMMNEHTDIHSAQWAEELESTRQEYDDKLDDDFYGVRIKLEDYIQEELAEAEERIIEHLQSTASVHLEFGA